MRPEKLEIGHKKSRENTFNFYRFRKNIWDRAVNASILYVILIEIGGFLSKCQNLLRLGMEFNVEVTI
jgi:Zn-dependent membrane protease YugP